MNCCLYLKNYENIKFIFIGGGIKNKAILKFAKEKKLNNCTFLPYQDLDQLPYSLTCADLALITIEDGMESLIAPSKLYGHLAAGTCIAVISPKNCYLKDIISKEKFGKWFQNGDYIGLSKWINHLSKDKKEIKKMKYLSRKYIENYASLEIVTKKYLDLINKI